MYFPQASSSPMAEFGKERDKEWKKRKGICVRRERSRGDPEKQGKRKRKRNKKKERYGLPYLAIITT